VDGLPDAEVLQQLQEALRLQQANQEQAARDSKVKAAEGRENQSTLARPVPTTRPQSPQLIRDELSDGSLGPEMLVLPAGSFLMGSPEDEPERSSDEGPQLRVEVAAFAIGRTEVTFEQYDRFAKSTGRKLPDDAGWGRGRRPVINVSWEDASAYAAWLSDQTRQRYRLPSEAEWEYATRAGTQRPFSTGDCIHTDQANYNGNYDYQACGARSDSYRRKTVPTGSLPANPWGLHEVHGNVWEWVQDCFHDSYKGAPDDGSAWEVGGDCTLRVVRGGGWISKPENLRSANRTWITTGEAINNLGFRLARTL
jgi:formylglycine-generating enzyme required for sulfatase activity